MAKPLRHLMLATGEDVSDPKAWSGIPYSMRQALERKVERLTVFQPPPPARPPLDLALRLALGARRYPLWITPATLRQNARALRAAVAQEKPDAVLSIAGMCVAALGDPPVPSYLFSDAPYEAFHEAYRGTIDRPFLLGKYQKLEALAARQLDGLCYSSAWAVAEGRKLFGPVGRGGAPMETRLHVTEMGSNWAPAMSRDELFARVDARPQDRIDLLFLGRDWERKGGPLAVEVTRLLREAGVAATLHVVGCTPELSVEYVKLHGALYRTERRPGCDAVELVSGLAFSAHAYHSRVLRAGVWGGAGVCAAAYLARRAGFAGSCRRWRDRIAVRSGSRSASLCRPDPSPAQ